MNQMYLHSFQRPELNFVNETVQTGFERKCKQKYIYYYKTPETLICARCFISQNKGIKIKINVPNIPFVIYATFYGSLNNTLI